MSFKRIGCLVYYTFLASVMLGQDINTENGWKLPPYGDINILMIYAEVEYDVNENKDPYPNGRSWWRPGQFPTWKGELIDTLPGARNGQITHFFDCMSFGKYQVRARNYPKLVKVKASEISNLTSTSKNFKAVIENIQKDSVIFNDELLADLDQWNFSGPDGSKKVNQSNGQIDMVMILFRNTPAYRNGSGHVRKGNIGFIKGMKSDAYSVFGAGDGIPFNIMRHEYSHMLFGGNNFHCGGGQHSGGGANHFIPFQGAWSMLGGYNSSFKLGNAWDRDRLGWKPDDKKYTISALNMNNQEVSTAIVANDSLSEQTYILRDYVSSGDAIQIKLPYLDEDEYPQYLWLENHQGFNKNGNDLDRYQYDEAECIPDTKSGIYAYMQVAHDQKTGKDIFKGYGDYIRNLPADGYHDILFLDTMVQNTWCVNNKWYYPYVKKKSHENPLCGNGDQEEVAFDKNRDGRIGKNEGRRLVLESKLGNIIYHLPTLGHRRHAFSPGQKDIIGIGTNPSTSSMKTLTSYERRKADVFNNKNVTLNGLEINILEQLKDGSIKVQIQFNQTRIKKNRRWAGDDIILPAIKGAEEHSLILSKKRKIELVRSKTPTKINEPEITGSDTIFSNPTRLIVQNNASVLLEKKAKFIIKEGSSLIFQSKSDLFFKRKARITIEKGSQVILPERLNQKKILKNIKIENGGELIFKKL